MRQEIDGLLNESTGKIMRESDQVGHDEAKQQKYDEMQNQLSMQFRRDLQITLSKDLFQRRINSRENQPWVKNKITRVVSSSVKSSLDHTSSTRTQLWS